MEYHFGTSTATGHSNDISEGGMFLECDHVAAQGTRVYLRVYLPGSHAGDPLKIIGIVTRTVDADHAEAAGSPTGMGLHFEVAYARTREQLASFMTSLLELDPNRAAESDSSAGGSPRQSSPDIRLVRGSTAEDRTYLARFPELKSAGYQRMDTLRPPDVERVFAFDAPKQVAPHPRVRWGAIGGTAIKLLLLVGVLVMIVYSVAMYMGKFAGAR